MIEQSRGLSFVAYSYEGGPLRFTCTFPYLLKEHVRVLVGDPESPRSVYFTWVDSTTVEIADQAEYLTAPYNVLLRRVTPYADQAVHFQDSARLPASQLNTAIRQLLYVQQETTEFGTSGGNIPGAGSGGGSGGGGVPADIQTIIDQVIQSPAYQKLSERIPEIDSNAERIIEELLRSDGFNTTKMEHGKALAVHGEKLTLLADETGASTEWIRIFGSQWTDDPANGATTAAAVKEQINTKATPEEAEAIASTAVTAFAEGTFAALQESFEAYASTNDNKWSSTWSLRINGGDINNPVISGIALSADENGSDFVVMADRFAFTGPADGYGNRKFPFVIGTVGGVSTVGIQGQLVVDGSITANKITANTLSAITANAGTINGGTFKTLSLDANGAPINELEFRAEMSNVGNWPLWIGTGVKNENNAVFYVDREGNAAFAGRVSAPNIMGTLQQYVVCAWSGTINGTSGGATSTFVLPAPVLLGETHVPMVQLSLTLNNTHSDEFGSVYVTLRRLVGSTWISVRGPYLVGLNHGESRADALFTADLPTSADNRYQVLIESVSGRSDNINLLAVDGLIFGLR